MQKPTAERTQPAENSFLHLGNSNRLPQTLTAISLGLLIAFYLVTSLYIAAHRPFWFDEIITVLIARLNSYSAIWQALTQLCDVLPPHYYMLVRPFDSSFGGEIGARVPSALAMVAGMLIIFDCTRRLSNGLFGLIAVSVLTCSLLPYYGFEARPYSLYFALASLTLWLWIHTRDGGLRSPILFGGTFFVAFSLHYYSFLCLVPYAAAMILDPAQRRGRFSKFAAGCLGVMCAAALSYGPILAARGLSSVFWADPTIGKLKNVYLEFFPTGAFLLAGIMLCIALTTREGKKVVLLPMSPSERLGWLFFLIPIAGFIVAKFATNAFYNRYFIGMLPGVAFAFSSLLWRNMKHLPRVSIGILLLLSGAGIYHQVQTVRHLDAIEPPSAVGHAALSKQVLLLEDMFRDDGKQYVVLSADLVSGLPAIYYAKHSERFFLYVDDNPGVIAKAMINLGRFYPIKFWYPADLKRHGREAALVTLKNDELGFLERNGLKADTRVFGIVRVVYPQ